ncbi:class A beta-lactamase-related serine hydrolase [Isoptericola sp. NEAU-Y5]|uniref:Class A beta-lactamase-related serine hydrolase n=1 Tax=Isoptericola luteus TaxID=2879484 RepID=A0ABS7ZEK8_9MICO|nr:serine hydrolase [Isoptericola sp. NEAU-Y5]MCA5892912.1 class A beta-lactamase-related serine hydrolase [Isoptericola sp. NEAU-Y5]
MPAVGTHSDGVPLVAYQVRRAGGGVLAARAADESFYAASTVKLAVLVAAARALEAGALTLDDEVVSTDTFASQVPGAPDYRIEPDDLDGGMPAPGTPMPVRDVLTRMVVVSSNEATNMAIDLVGLEASNRVLADAGASSSTVGRKYSDLAAEELGASHRTTAADLAALMAALVTGRLAGPVWTRWALELLGLQSDRQLTAAVPAGVPHGSKSGWVDGIRHDVAFVGEPGADTLVVAVCTRGYAVQDAEETLRALGELALTLAPDVTGAAAPVPAVSAAAGPTPPTSPRS